MENSKFRVTATINDEPHVWYYTSYHEAEFKVEWLIREYGLGSNDITFEHAPFSAAGY